MRTMGGRYPAAYNRAMDEVRKAAAARGQQLGLSYAGAVTPAEAHAFMGAGAHVVERFRLTGKDTLDYQATVENPAVFSRPFTLRVPLRRRPADVELLEYGCIEGERDAAHLLDPAVVEDVQVAHL